MSRTNTPLRVSSKVFPVKHIRLSRNSSLPTLRGSFISAVTQGNEDSLNVSQPKQHTIVTQRQSIRHFLDTEISGVQESTILPRVDVLNPIRNTERKREIVKPKKVFEAKVFSENSAHVPKLLDVLRDPRNSNRRKKGPIKLGDPKGSIGRPNFLQVRNSAAENRQEDNDTSVTLNWDTEEDVKWIGKNLSPEAIQEQDCDAFWRFGNQYSARDQILNRSIIRVDSPDLIKCSMCKKCSRCVNCKKCTLTFQCVNCLRCERCFKCDNCQVKEDLSPERGVSIKNEFFGRFKSFEDLQRKGMLKKNPRDEYLKSCREQQILPFHLHMYNAQENEGRRVNLRYYGIRNTRARALASSVSINEDLENIDLTSNGMQGKDIAEVVSKLTYKVKCVDVSNNKVNDFGLNALCALVKNHKYSSLRILKLEGLGINDRQGEIFAQEIVENPYIKILNLSRNNLGNRTMTLLSKFLVESNSIQQLYLHWNNISWRGCCEIAEGLCKNDSLKVLDLSWNKIGHRTNKFSCEKLSDMFIQNTSLVHVDFSFCGLREEECTELAQGLLKNQTILGVHMAGNKWTADDNGFLKKIVDFETAIIRDALWKRLPRARERGQNNATKATGNCWICEGWREIKFVWKNTKEEKNPEPIYVHLGFDNWKGHLLEKEEDNTYALYKMCPPGNLRFYYSIQGKRTEISLETEATETLPEIEQYHTTEQTQIPQENKLFVPTVGLMTVEYFEPLVSETLDLAIERCVPRPRPPPSLEDNLWKFKTSIFRTYRRDDDDLERKCYEFDFETSKIRKILAKGCEDIILLKEELWRYYKRLRAAFKYYSAQSPIGEVFCMPLNPLTEFIMKTNVVDNKSLKLHAIDKNFIAVKSLGAKRHPRNPEKALVRYQFLEILLRCAIEKFIVSKKTTSYVEAVQWFMEEVSPHCEEFEHNAFRLKRLWNPFNDFIYQANLNLMKKIYFKYCDHENALKNRKNWNFADYNKFLRDIDIINVHITEREPAPIFNLAMMTQIDEIGGDRHTKMMFVEFLDMFARLADRLTPTDENPMRELHDKIAELMRICAFKCFNVPSYQVVMPPLSLKEKVIDLSY